MNMHFVNRIFWGLALIGVGVLFLLNRAGIVSFDLGDLIRVYWPVVIIYFAGAGLLFQRKNNGGWVGAYLWNLVGLAVGFYFLGRNLGIVDFSFGQLISYALPLVLIVFGIQMIFGSRNRSSDSRDTGTSERKPEATVEEIPDLSPPPETPVSNFDEQFEARFGRAENPEQKRESERFGPERLVEAGHAEYERREAHHAGHYTHWNKHAENRSSFIGDIKVGQDYYDLKPMNLSLFIGDTVLDLTKARIPAEETRINISSFIGDVKIYLPNDVDLEVCVVSSSFLGDSNVLDRKESGMFKNMNLMTPGYREADKRVRIHVSVFIGDLNVQRVG